MKLLIKYLRPYVGRMSFGFVIKIIGTIMDLFLPWILSYIIDDVIPRKNVQEIFLWGGLMGKPHGYGGGMRMYANGTA